MEVEGVEQVCPDDDVSTNRLWIRWSEVHVYWNQASPGEDPALTHDQAPQADPPPWATLSLRRLAVYGSELPPAEFDPVAFRARFAPAVHAGVQTPPEQVPVHGRLQPPQCVVDVRVSASQPLPALPSQSAKPVLHENPQLPPLQVVEALPRVGQTLPQVPQLDVSLPRVRHAPLQGVWPLGQTLVHVPLEQTCPAPHARPQAPQLAPSAWRFRQVPLQLVKPGPQTTAHPPATQLCPVGHTRPQPPQFEPSLWRSRQTPAQLV
jgi:hypothetical protein